MTLIGNILLFISVLIWFSQISVLYFKKAPRGGDAAVSYIWGIIFQYIAFSVCMALALIMVAGEGGFNWIPATKGMKYLLVILGFLSAMVTTALSALFKNESGPVSPLLRFYSVFVPILVPGSLILIFAILLNSGIRQTVPVAVVQWPLVLDGVLGVTGILAALSDLITQRNRNRTAVQKRRESDYDDNNKRMMREIDEVDVNKNLVFLLVFTDYNKIPEVKDRAVAKLKTNPEWKAELIRLLDTDWAPEVFTFLASHAVDEPGLFAEPVRRGIGVQARLIREHIRRCSHDSHFYAGQFSWEVERVLLTVRRFRDSGIDYRPALRELRASLDERSEYKKVDFMCIPFLDEEIRKL